MKFPRLQAEDLLEIEALVLQMQEWIGPCPSKHRCPIHRKLQLFIMLFYDNVALKKEIEQMQEYPGKA